MSGELKPVVKPEVGQSVTAQRMYGRKVMEERPAVVTKVSRVWAEAEVETSGRKVITRFRMDTGARDTNSFYSIVIPEVVAYEQRVMAAWAVLKEHGLEKIGYGSAKIHDAKLFAVADLLK